MRYTGKIIIVTKRNRDNAWIPIKLEDYVEQASKI